MQLQIENEATNRPPSCAVQLSHGVFHEEPRYVDIGQCLSQTLNRSRAKADRSLRLHDP
jgi:hypothetical protein